MRQENRITIILIVVVIVFLICQMPTGMQYPNFQFPYIFFGAFLQNYIYNRNFFCTNPSLNLFPSSCSHLHLDSQRGARLRRIQHFVGSRKHFQPAGGNQRILQLSPVHRSQ